MKLSKRQEIILSEIKKTSVLADIGCDHGIIAFSALEKGLCERAVLADVSAKSLEKAKTLCHKYLQNQKAVAVISNGYAEILKLSGEFLPTFSIIAGMGGREIIDIIKCVGEDFLPKAFLLQPMKNAESVREFMLSAGYKLEKDYTFFDGGKRYDLILADKEVGKANYSKLELYFGYGNLKGGNKEFLSYLEESLPGFEKALKRAKGNLDIIEKIEITKRGIYEIRKNN